MPEVTPGSTIKSLVEIGWLAARVGRQLIAGTTEPSPGPMQAFWQNARSLQAHWTGQLDVWSSATDPDLDHLEEIAGQLFTTELMCRVWATVLAEIDRQTGRSDLTRIARNTVNGLLQVRHRVMTHMVDVPAAQESRAAEIDRLRRRCDRWTDLLVGNTSGLEGTFDFAMNAERARDFAEEYAEEASVSRNAMNRLAAAGLRLAFVSQLPDVALNEPEFEKLTQSILTVLPISESRRDTAALVTETPVDSLEMNASERPVTEVPLNPTCNDVLLPGISFAKLRRRFR
jgi:hypothetical protein